MSFRTLLRDALRGHPPAAKRPLMRDAKTWNTSHPDYDARAARNLPGVIFNPSAECRNLVYRNLPGMAESGQRIVMVPPMYWDPIVGTMFEEAFSLPEAGTVLQRRGFVERYARDLGEEYGSSYSPGWVNQADALLLYWLVRRADPKIIVQSGICNGFSTAMMVLALIRNGSGGRIYGIDFPYVFDSNEAWWTRRGEEYGVIIPEGKQSGWLVPDLYRDRVEICCGDAKELLPGLIDDLDHVDLFFHDSDHSYDHMMFEFREIHRKLAPGGIIVADDISWNASLWDFADAEGVPALNFNGAIGAAFF